jgi:hypothetical protein
VIGKYGDYLVNSFCSNTVFDFSENSLAGQKYKIVDGLRGLQVDFLRKANKNFESYYLPILQKITKFSAVSNNLSFQPGVE